MDLNLWKDISEIAKNVVYVFGLLGGLFLLYQWIYARRDRGTDLLIQLDKQFTTPDMVEARQLIEDDESYLEVRRILLAEISADDLIRMGIKVDGADRPQDAVRITKALDQLLRFYVLICGVRQAKQVSDSALRICFRYWLAQYYNPRRRELRLYVNRYYPTLAAWLKKDRRRFPHLFRRSFFEPEQFGWYPNRKPTRNELQRAMDGRVLVISGAGISADSGVPTYRSQHGYWRNLNPYALATRASFLSDPDLVWQWYAERRRLIAQCAPNPAHAALVELQQQAQEFLLITQNVDDLHQRAGLDPERIVQIHGNIFLNQCSTCGLQNDDDITVPPLPQCKCGSWLRPGVVWFDEELDQRQVDRIEQYLQKGKCDLVLVIGTSAMFDYVIDWAFRGAADDGLLIEINPNETRLTDLVNQSIRRKASQAVPSIISS